MALPKVEGLELGPAQVEDLLKQGLFMHGRLVDASPITISKQGLHGEGTLQIEVQPVQHNDITLLVPQGSWQ